MIDQSDIDAPDVKAIPGWRASLSLIFPLVAYKLLLILVIFASFKLLQVPVDFPDMPSNVYWKGSMLPAFSSYDSNYYLGIAAHGYAAGAADCNFFPLWPLLIHIFSWGLFTKATVPAVIISNVLSVTALILFHRLAILRMGASAAGISLLLLLAFPTAFFLSLPYSESLFLLLAVGLFLARESDCAWGAYVCAFLLPLARPVGVFCLAPICVDLLRHHRRRPLLYLIMPILGLCVYFIIMQAQTGDALATFHVQNHFVAQGSLSRVLHPLAFGHELFSRGLVLHDFKHSIIDRAIFLICIATMIYPMWRRPVDLAYCLPLVFVPAMTEDFMSFARYALVLFPLYLAWAPGFVRPRARPWFFVVIAASFSLQLILLIRHVHGAWAG